MRPGFHTRLFSSFLVFQLVAVSLPVFAQKRRAPASALEAVAVNSTRKPVCSGGWSGSVTLTKTLQESRQSDEPGIRKDIDRIIHNDSRNYQYTAHTLVDSSDPQKPTVVSDINFTDDDKSYGLEKVFDTCNSRENGHWFTIEGTDNRLTKAQAKGPAESFNLVVNEMAGTYSFSMELPDIKGTFNREEHVKRAGHCQPKNNEPYDRSTNEIAKVEGESISVNEKFDPRDPDTITGTKVWGDDGKGQVRTFIYKATWRFTRCPQKLLVTELKFEHPQFPNYDDWGEVVDERGTVDGNLIKVKAKVWNRSSEAKFAEIAFKETYEGDKWDGAKKDVPVHESVSVKLEPGEEREIEVLWSTNGYGWFDDGRPRLLQRIKVEAWENFKLQDKLTKNLKIAPRPLVLVPGIWTDLNAFEMYQNLLTASHSYDWKALVFKPAHSPQSVFDRSDDLAKFVFDSQKNLNAWHIDMLGHSTGGLIARLYIHKNVPDLGPDGRPVVRHLLMLGTPNNGVPCADSISVLPAQFGADAARTAQELMPEEIARFNQFVNQRKGARFAALVGNGMPLLCASPQWNDGFVSVESAKFGISDFAVTKDNHPDLTDAKHFGEFIKPHLVTGPRGTYPLPVVSGEGGVDGRTAGN